MTYLKNTMVTLWLLLVKNPAALRFPDGSLLTGFSFAKQHGKGVVLRKLFSLRVKFPTPAPARMTKSGCIVEFLVDSIVVATGRARKLLPDNQTFICRDVKAIEVDAFELLLKGENVSVRVSGIDEGEVTISQIDEIEHPVNSPIVDFIQSGEVTAIEIKYLKPKDRFEAFAQIVLANKDTGKIVLHGDFKGKRLFVYMATPEVWARVIGGKDATVEWLYQQKNLSKVLKLMLTPTKAVFKELEKARVYVGAKNGKDGPIFFAYPIRNERLENGNCQTRTNPSECGLGCKGLGISEMDEFIRECEYYGISPLDYDIIINEDAIKVNAINAKAGDSIELSWTAIRMINLNLRKGSGHIGRQIVMTYWKISMKILNELGLMERVAQYIQLCKWNWAAWLKICSSINDSKMEDNFFHSFLDLQPEHEDWVLPQDQTSLTRAKARLEIAWNDMLIKLPFGNRSYQIGYDFRVDAAEEAWANEHLGEVRHFAVYPPECVAELDKFGSMAIATFPQVNDKGLLTAFPLLDDQGNYILGPKGMILFSRLFLKKKWRDGDGDKCAAKGLKTIIELPFHDIVDEAEEPKMVVTNVSECNMKVMIQAQASWASSINVGIEDLTCSYIAMSLHRQGYMISAEEQSDLGFRREAEGLHLLKHATGAGKSIVTDANKITEELLLRFGGGKVQKPSERQQLYYWVDRNDPKKSKWPSAKKAFAAMDASYNPRNPGEVDHFLITKGANILCAPNIRIMHRLTNLLPAMFAGVMQGRETLEDRCAGNPYGWAMAHLFVNRVWENLNGNPKHADNIYKAKKEAWDFQVACHKAGKGLISDKGYQWNIDVVAIIAKRLDAFYTDATHVINAEYKASKDWSTRGLKKHIQYGSLFRSIRYMLDGKNPGYEELYDCPASVVSEHMGTIISLLPIMIQIMGDEERLHFLTLLAGAVAVEGWGLSRGGKGRRKSGGVTRLMPFEGSVLSSIQYWKFKYMVFTMIDKMTPAAAIAKVNPVMRRYIDPMFDDGKFDILKLGKEFDIRRMKQDIEISAGNKSEEIAPVDMDTVEDEESTPDLLDEDGDD